jgi:crotonobetainyl-CoA:carnitine CoA-transferase CaiB-like acyl-CoA transferase
MAMEQLLSGYRVLDFTHAIAGPTTTLLMAEMGADVIKVEHPPYGDMMRLAPFARNGRSGCYVQHNRGKKSLCVALDKPEGLEIIRKLLPKVDVLIENFSPGVMKRLGLDYEKVSAINPGIIMCSISTFGQTGALAHKPGFDGIGAAYTGISHRLGAAGQPPDYPQSAGGDVASGGFAFGAIGYALLHRERTGKGQYIETSLIDTYLTFHETALQVVSASRGAIKISRTGPHCELYAPVGAYEGKKGYIMLGASPQNHFAALCRAMGKPELKDDPRFKNNDLRAVNQTTLAAIIQEWISSLASDEAVLKVLDDNHIPCAPVLTIEEVIDNPHLRERGAVKIVNDPIIGEIAVPGFPIKFARTPAVEDLPAAYLGEHNAEVLRDYLGYGAGQIEALAEQGILQSRPEG